MLLVNPLMSTNSSAALKKLHCKCARLLLSSSALSSRAALLAGAARQRCTKRLGTHAARHSRAREGACVVTPVLSATEGLSLRVAGTVPGAAALYLNWLEISVVVMFDCT
jgi:hypothetical protein